MTARVLIPLSICAILGALFGAAYFGGSSLLPSLRGTDAVAIVDAPEKGKRAPLFDLPDSGEGRVRLAEYGNEPLIILFFATWNSEAADQLKILDDYRMGGGLVRSIAIASQEEKTIVSSFIRRGGYTVPVALDQRGATSEAYGIKSLPTLFFIGRDSIIHDIAIGVLSEQQIGDRAERILE
ncbi:MAG: redoxin domain-containing protein [Minisyncoccia bacterium]